MLHVNHYKVRSREDWDRRVAALDQTGFLKGKFSEPETCFEAYERRCNEMHQTGILRFADPLRRALNGDVDPSPYRKPYFLVVVAIFRAEDLYLEEWLNFHLLQGVEHFYLYSNENPPSTLALLHPYIEAGYLTVVDWPDTRLATVPLERRRLRRLDRHLQSIQNIAYRHFVEARRRTYCWAMKIDIDEFVYPVDPWIPDLRTALREHYPSSTTKQITVPRSNFGSNGHISRPSGLVIENYLKSEARPSSVKSIGNSRFVVPPSYSCHAFNIADSDNKDTHR